MSFEEALAELLTELIDGSSPTWTWVLGPGDPGLSGTLTSISAEVASVRPSAAKNSIAAHVRHVCYGLELLNRWAQGEENPFADADWPHSWSRPAVTAGEWSKLIAELKTKSAQWISAVRERREWDPISMRGALASAAHIAYHFGAI